MTNLFGEDTSINQEVTRQKKMCKQRSLHDYFQIDIYGNLPTAGKDKMPVLEPYNGDIPNKIVAFDEAYTQKETNCIVHFYEDDRRFLRLFRNPEKYLCFLKKCTAVIGPDLSQFIDMDYHTRLYHAYLNRAMAAWLQKNGVNIIPNVTWSCRDSFEYSRIGMPHNSIIAVNCTGILGHDVSMYMWREGYKNVVLPLQPSIIIRYGDKMPDENDRITIHFDNERLKRLRHGS